MSASGAFAPHCLEGQIEFADRGGIEWLDFKSHSGGGLLRVPQCSLSSVRIDRIYEHGNTNGLGYHVIQEPQPLSRNLCCQKIGAGRVAAGVSEAGDKAKLDRVYTFAEDDWDRCCAAFTASATSGVPTVAITATWRRTKSAISAGRRSYGLSSQWYSTVKFWPST